ncbi:uncharacterized protein LOC123534882 [Mercenaria mercenaria]|uniref:uncharacterized protein LOC123534882 n=1 Tax=Mercenaria mercenaria TaxID=6596 RepID=UPI00234E7B2B|nr:uncharacterized protein LOC123534882 [Mercenaria mercenaria]
MGNNSTTYATVELVRSEDAVTFREGLDGPEEAVTQREEEHDPEERVTIMEESESISNNKQVIERHTEQKSTGANIKGCDIRNVLILALAVVFLVAASAIITYLAKRNPESKESSPAAQSWKFSNDVIDLRISAENSSCEGPSCIICKTDVMPHFEAFHCAESDPNVKNGSCFLCGGKCMPLQSLLDKVKQNATRVCKKPRIELTCCILAIMGKFAHYCGKEGQYLCYNETVHDYHNQSVHEPLCWCPSGNVSEHCNKPYTEAADCRCFKSTRKFCGQEQITQCDNVKANWSTCHMNRTELNEQYNCLCNKSTGTEDHSTQCT